jgi:LPXTG-motif cell wall-anchored protein
VGGGTGAGIGGGGYQDGGTITIGGSAVVNVVTGNYAAGIGGGRDGAGGDITINGGTVSVTTAVWDETGAAIGGGERGAGGTITINGGTVTADARRVVQPNDTGSAGIGSGDASVNNSGQSGIVGGDEAAGGIITINGGTVTARGSGRGAGIGGGALVDGWIVEINGGTVNAYGGNEAAGIGGGQSGDGGNISINGGDVYASGGQDAAGIGGGDGAAGGGGGGIISITSDVSAPTVTAVSVRYGAGIGGGELGGPTTITIEEGADVSADGSNFGPALGRGINGDPATWSIGGALDLPNPDGFLTVYPGDTASITATGVVSGAASVGVVAGEELTNNGIITSTSVGPQDLILDHSYRFEFDGNFVGAAPLDAVEVFAPTFQSGERELPAPTRLGFFLGGWNTESDGSGATVTPTSTIAAGGTLYAQWTNDALAVIPATDTVTAGGDIEFRIEDRSDSDLDVTMFSTVTTGEASDVVTTQTNGLIEFTQAGERLITATLVGDASKTGTTTITVIADSANPTALDATPSATTVDVGGSITFDFALLDPYGNPFPVGGAVVLTSDVATDIIDGNRVTFPTASVHTITATYEDFVTTVEITVSPASDLADTGANPAVPLGLAGLLLTLGTVLLLVRRRAIA